MLARLLGLPPSADPTAQKGQEHQPPTTAWNAVPSNPLVNVWYGDSMTAYCPETTHSGLPPLSMNYIGAVVPWRFAEAAVYLETSVAMAMMAEGLVSGRAR